MALIWKDRVQETSTTTGTSAFTLAGAVDRYRTFASVCSTSDTLYYSIEGAAGTGEWETGIGTYSGTNTLTRTTVLASSNSGSAVSFSAGTKTVILTPLATQFASPDFYLVSEVVPSSTGTVTFSSLPSGYRDLKIKVRGAGTKAATFVEVRMQFNGDTTANYDFVGMAVNNTSLSNTPNSGATYLWMGWIPAASGISNPGGAVEIDIYDYANTTTVKTALSKTWLRTGTANTGLWKADIGGNWRSTAAITSVTVFLDANNYSNAVVSLYASK